MELRWEPHFADGDSILYLWLGSNQVARVARRVDGVGWRSEVGRHRRDWKRRPSLIAPSRRTAMRWAEAWTRANLARVWDELPRLYRTSCGTWTQACPVRR